jgi:hypothetical protein
MENILNANQLLFFLAVLQIKMLPLQLMDLTKVSTDVGCNYPTMDVSVQADRAPSAEHFIYMMQHFVPIYHVVSVDSMLYGSVSVVFLFCWRCLFY